MRQGLLALRRCRPAVEEDEGVWLALSWLDGRCSQEELERRVVEAKAARAEWDPPQRKAPPLSDRAQALRGYAKEAAAELAKEAGVAELAVAATAERTGSAFLARLFGYQLGTVHSLMMRLSGGTNRALDRAVETHADPAVAVKLSGIVARLGDRFRRGVETIQRLAVGPDGKPRKVTGLVWGGPEARPADADSAPANDNPDSLTAGPATAGHGVDRLDSIQHDQPGDTASQAAA